MANDNQDVIQGARSIRVSPAQLAAAAKLAAAFQNQSASAPLGNSRKWH